MHGNGMPDDPGEIKPGESLHTPEWHSFSRTLSLTERGIAVSLLVLMHLRGWRSLQELPSNQVLGKALGCGTVVVGRIRARLTSHAEVFDAQVKRVARWPAWIIAEFEP